MNRNLLIPLFSAIELFSCMAQNNWDHYDWASQKREDNRNIYNYSLNFNLSKYRNNIYIGEQYKLFSKENALSTFDDLNSGSIYTSFYGYETYVKKVLETIVKDTSITNRIRIYFSRDDEFNASIDGSGFLLINIGIIEDMNSEAELALLLGHEVAHYLNEDAIKNYGKWLEMKYADRGGFSAIPVAGLFIDIFQTVNMFELKKNYYCFSREQEAEADRMSLKLLNESPYSLNSASLLLRRMKRNEIRSELQFGKRSKAYVSHPDPGDRLNRIKILSSETGDKAEKNFVVDSISFMRLREICYHETVNMGLINNNLNGLITNLFSRYLLEPENEENLAILIECLRRTLIFGKESKIYDKSFILSQYQTKAIDGSSRYIFLKETKPSILNHLNKGFINVWKEDLSKIKTNDLIDTTYTEFSTYLEAYLYFKDKAKLTNNQLAAHYNYFGSQQNFADVDQYMKRNSVFASNDYLSERGVLSPGKEDVFILVPPESSDVLNANGELDLETYLKGNNLFLQAAMTKLGKNVFLMSDFDYSEIHLLNSLMGHCNYYLKLTKDPIIKRQKINWIESCPELYGFFKKRNLGNIYIYRATIINSKEFNGDFYKISLPNGNSSTFSGQRKLTKADGIEKVSMDFEKISDQFLFFYKSCNR